MVEKGKLETNIEEDVPVKVPKDIPKVLLVAGGILGIGAASVLVYMVGKQEGYNQFKDALVAAMERVEYEKSFVEFIESGAS